MSDISCDARSMSVHVVVHEDGPQERLSVMSIDSEHIANLVLLMHAPYPPVFRKEHEPHRLENDDEIGRAFEAARESAFCLFKDAEVVIVLRDSIHVFMPGGLDSIALLAEFSTLASASDQNDGLEEPMLSKEPR